MTFDGSTAQHIVILGSNVTVGSMTVTGGTTYAFDGTGGITGSTSQSTGIVPTGKLTVTDSSFVILSNAGTNSFVETKIDTESRVRLDGVGNLGGAIVNDGEFTVNRANAYTLDNAISGNGVMKMTGSGELTISGTNTQANDFVQTAGIVNLRKTWTGDYTQNGGLLTGTGKVDGDLVSVTNIMSGNTTAIGTLTVTGNADFGDASLRFKVDGVNSDRIVVDGDVTLGSGAGKTTIDILNFTPGATAYTLLTGGNEFWVDGGNFVTLVGGSAASGRQTITYDNSDKMAVKLTLGATGNLPLVWAGATGDLWRGTNRWTKSIPNDETFIDGDTVTFDEIIGRETQAVGLGTSDVTVANMTVNGGDYTFTGDGVGIRSTDGKLDVQGGAVTLANTGVSNFSQGANVSGGATLQLGNDNSGGSFVGDVANAGTLAFKRSDDFTFGNTIAGTGIVRQAGSGTVTLNGTSQTGALEQTNGTIELAETWNGDFDQTAGKLTGGGTLNGVAELHDVVAPTGTLVLDSATLYGGSTLHIGTLGTDVLSVTNTLAFVTTGGKIAVDIGHWDIASNVTIIDDSIDGSLDLDATFAAVTLNGQALGGRQRATLSVNGGDLQLTTTADNGSLTWTGAGDKWNSTDANWTGIDTKFIDGDTVTFEDTLGQTIISVQNSGVKVLDMTVNNDANNYVFNIGGITATGKLVKTNDGLLTLNNANSFADGTDLDGGRINIGNDNALGTQAVRMAAGTTLGFTGDRTISNAVTLNGAATLDTADHAATMIGAIGGGSGFTKTGSGTLILAADNDYNDTTTVSGGTLQVGNGGTTGSIVSDVALASVTHFVFNRSDDVDYSNIISGSGNVTKNGGGNLTLSGDSSAFAGVFTQATGGVHMTGKLGGTFTQNSGAAFTSTNGATLNDAIFKGSVAPTGTLHVLNDAAFDDAEVDFGRLISRNTIVVAGRLTIAGSGAIIDADGASGSYTLFEYGTISSDGINAITLKNLGENRGGTYINAANNAFMCDIVAGNTTLYWNGSDGKTDWNVGIVNRNWSTGDFDTYFKSGDTVFFDGTAANKNATVSTDGVDVASMTVSDAYKFSGGQIRATGDVDVTTTGSLGLVVGATPALTAASVNFNTSGKLDITGYTPDETSPFNAPRNVQTLIRTTNGVRNFNTSATVMDQADVDFLSANAFVDGNDVKVETTLTWYSTDPDRPAHGNFTIADGKTFTLGAALAEVAGNGNWDGKSLTKLGGGTLVITGANTTTGTFTQSVGDVVLDKQWSGDYVQNSGLLTTGVETTIVGDASLKNIDVAGTGIGTLHVGDVTFNNATITLDIAADGSLADRIVSSGDIIATGTNVLDFNRSGYQAGTFTLLAGANAWTQAMLDSFSVDPAMSGARKKADLQIGADGKSLEMTVTLGGNLTLVWKGGDGDWLGPNWNNSPDGGYIDGDKVIFEQLPGAPVKGTVGLGGNIVAPASVTVKSGVDYLFTNGTTNATGAVLVEAGGRMGLDVSNTKLAGENVTFIGDAYLAGTPRVAPGATETISNVITATGGGIDHARFEELFNASTALKSQAAIFNAVPGGSESMDMRFTTLTVEQFTDKNNLSSNTEKMAELFDAAVANGKLADFFYGDGAFDTDAMLEQFLYGTLGGELAADARTMALWRPWKHVYDRMYDVNEHYSRGYLGQCGTKRSNRELWGSGYYRSETVHGDGNAQRYDGTRGGMMVGVDAKLNSWALVGLAFGYGNPRVLNDIGKIEADDYTVALYSKVRVVNNLYANAFLGYGHQEYKYRRYATGIQKTKYDGDSMYASVEFLRPMKLRNGLTLFPLFAVDFQKAWTDGFTESSTNVSQLSVAKSDVDQTVLRFGLNSKYSWTNRLNMRTRLQYGVQVGGDVQGRALTSLVANPGESRMLTGVNLGRSTFNVGFGGDWYVSSSKRTRLFADYDFDLGENTTAHTGQAGFATNW